MSVFQMFIDFLAKFDGVAANTLKEDPNENWTVLYDNLRQEDGNPVTKQIDHFTISKKLEGKASCGIIEFDATSSDHRCLRLSILGGKKRAHHMRSPPKPIGWRCVGPAIGGMVADVFEVSPLDWQLPEAFRSSFHLWCDGSKKGNTIVKAGGDSLC